MSVVVERLPITSGRHWYCCCRRSSSTLRAECGAL